MSETRQIPTARGGADEAAALARWTLQSDPRVGAAEWARLPEVVRAFYHRPAAAAPRRES